jgi:hypothetical protein
MSFEELGSATPVGDGVARLTIARANHRIDPVCAIKEAEVPGAEPNTDDEHKEHTFVAVNTDPDSQHLGEKMLAVCVEPLAKGAAQIDIHAMGEQVAKDPNLLKGVVYAVMDVCEVEVGVIPQDSADLPETTLAHAFTSTAQGYFVAERPIALI